MLQHKSLKVLKQNATMLGVVADVLVLGTLEVLDAATNLTNLKTMELMDEHDH